MYKDLLLVVTREGGDEAALAAAQSLAAHARAHLAALVVVEMPLPVPSEWGSFPAAALGGAADELRQAAREVAGKLRTRFASQDVSTEVRLVDAVFMPLPPTAALHARHADLALVGIPRNDGARGVAEATFVDLLMDSGRPVLLVPEGTSTRVPAPHAVVAWQPTREASRALHDALPLLCAADTVDVLLVDPKVGEGEHGDNPGADIALHLARHGIKVQVVVRHRASGTVAGTILAHVRESGAGLLVAGGYSRSRFRQQVLGGVTRELVDSAPVPVLFAH